MSPKRLAESNSVSGAPAQSSFCLLLSNNILFYSNLRIQKKSLVKMEDVLNEFLFISNPGYHHVAEKMLLSLDFKNLLKCRLVNSTWKNFLDMNPTFWIKKCQQFGLRDEICLAWKNLAQKLEQPDLIQDLVSTKYYLFD